jgi:hypothetical protein
MKLLITSSSLLGNLPSAMTKALGWCPKPYIAFLPSYYIVTDDSKEYLICNLTRNIQILRYTFDTIAIDKRYFFITYLVLKLNKLYIHQVRMYKSVSNSN